MPGSHCSRHRRYTGEPQSLLSQGFHSSVTGTFPGSFPQLLDSLCGNSKRLWLEKQISGEQSPKCHHGGFLLGFPKNILGTRHKNKSFALQIRYKRRRDKNEELSCGAVSSFSGPHHGASALFPQCFKTQSWEGHRACRAGSVPRKDTHSKSALQTRTWEPLASLGTYRYLHYQCVSAQILLSTCFCLGFLSLLTWQGSPGIIPSATLRLQ